MNASSAPCAVIQSFAAARDLASRNAVPQRYASEPGSFEAGDLLGEISAAARGFFGHDAFVIDSQTIELQPGSYPGIPVWSPAPRTGSGALVACLADEPLLELAGPDGPVAVPPDALVHLADGARLRFRSPETRQPVVVVLIRPRAGLRVWNRPRFSARLFSPRPAAWSATWPAWASKVDFEFDCCFELHGPMPVFTDDDIAREPVIGGASYAFAREVGGPIVQAWLDRWPTDWREDPDVIIIAARHELSPGWSPALLVWHMDGTSRCDKRSDGSPDLARPGRKVWQLAACVGEGSPLGLLRGPLSLPEVPMGQQSLGVVVWEHLIQEHIADGRVQATTVPPHHVFSYGWAGFHTATESRRPGWRCFLKAMRGRGDTPANQLHHRGAIAWPCDGPVWPADPLGVFPQDLPISAAVAGA